MHKEILESSEFKNLVRKRWSVSIMLTVTILFIYFGYLLVIAFNKPILAFPLKNGLTTGIPVGLGIIISAWLLTGIYVYWANRIYDKEVEEIKKKLIN